MRKYTLEQEFKNYVMIHKTAILQAKLTKHFRDLQETGIQIPFFMQESAETKAKKEVQNLLCINPLAFETLYQGAWQEYAECLP